MTLPRGPKSHFTKKRLSMLNSRLKDQTIIYCDGGGGSEG